MQLRVTRRSFQLGLAGLSLAPLAWAEQGQKAAETRRVVPGVDAPESSVAAPVKTSGRRSAIVIGNNEYRKAPRLKNATNDAEDLGGRLEKFGFSVTRCLNLNVGDTKAAIAKFASQLQPGDSALFYYSGHGVQAFGENFIVPVDYDPAKGEKSLETGCIRAKFGRDLMEKSGAQLNILILDACRDNPFHPNQKVEGMALMEPGLGTCIALATGPGRTASDNSGERNGLFTKYLLQEMARPGQSIEAMFKNVKDGVFTASGGKQRPWTFSDVVGEFYFGQPSGNVKQSGQAFPYLEAGKRQFEAGQFEEAATSFDRAMRVDPENPFPYNALGSARSRLRQWSIAVPLFARAIELKPDYAAAYFNRGVAYFNAARYELAVQDFSWAVDQEPYDPLALDLRGKGYLALRNHDAARQDFEHALTINPSDASAFSGRGDVLFRQGNYLDALRDLTTSLAIRPDPGALELRAKIHRAMRHTVEAESDLRQADILRSQH